MLREIIEKIIKARLSDKSLECHERIDLERLKKEYEELIEMENREIHNEQSGERMGAVGKARSDRTGTAG